MDTNDSNGILRTCVSHVHNHRAKYLIFSALAICAGFMLFLGGNRSSASWQREQLLNQDFWNTTPNTGNIVYSLFGDGSPGSTAYTRNRSGSCIPSSVVQLGSFSGITGAANTIYILNSGNYTLSTNIVLNTCSALIARGEVNINGNALRHLIVNGKSKVIIDGINVRNTNASPAMEILSSSNVTINAVQVDTAGNGILSSGSSYISVINTQSFENGGGIAFFGGHHLVANNILSYNNNYGLRSNNTNSDISISNSQFFNNNNEGVALGKNSAITNTMIYNNGVAGILFNPNTNTGSCYINNSAIYNNGIGINAITGIVGLFGTIQLFDNTSATGGNAATGRTSVTAPASLSWTAGTIQTGNIIDYNLVTNPMDAYDNKLLSGNTWTSLRGIIASRTAQARIRYLFGENIFKQKQAVMYTTGATFVEYGNNMMDFDSNKYIGELYPRFIPAYMFWVNKYFGSGSVYTQNWSGNACSLWSFQVITLNPGSYTGSKILQDHTIYILNSGQYKFTNNVSNGFVFNGNCVALAGSGDVRIDKSNIYVQNLLYADSKRNIILDGLKLDGLYADNGGTYIGQTNAGVNFAGTTYDTTINNVQTYNHRQYGIFLGANTHHTTIINTQTYNNREAGIYFYLASHHNVINNSMSYNNSGYGIWFANGSFRNAMNNFQSFNNLIGIFGDLTTKENIINRAMLYNNSIYGLYLKNSSGNILNDMQIYNNTTGVKIEFGSVNNIYNGEFKVFANRANFDGTNGQDSYLNAGSFSPFSAGVLTTGVQTMDCSYVTNPSFSGTTTYLLNTLSGCTATGSNYSVFNGWISAINYLFGVNIYKQTVPIRYTNTTVTTLPAQYDSGKYIAEIFAIRDVDLENVNFAFSGVIQPGTLYTSQVYTASAINTSVPVSFSIQPAGTGYLLINGVNVGTGGTVVNGDLLQIAMTSSATFSGIVTGTLLANGITSRDTVLQTRAMSTLPDSSSFAFVDILGAPAYSYTGSMVTVTGIDTGVLASINTGWIAIYSGGSLVSSGNTGMVYSGNQLLAMILVGSGSTSINTGIVTIGQGSGSFIVSPSQTIIVPIPSTSPILSFTDSVSSGLVYSDTISVQVSGSVSSVLYKFITSPSDCTSGGATTFTGLTTTISTETYNGKYFCVYGELSGVAMPLVSQYPLNIDHTSPTIPVFIYPEDGADVFFLVFELTGAYDAGGLSGYFYEIAEDYNFIDIISTGFVTTTGKSFSPNNFDETDGDYFWRVKALDQVGLTSSRSAQGSFVAIDNTDFVFPETEYADLDTFYTSDEITIDGLRTYGVALATVDTGFIYKNGTNRGQSTYVQNGDTIAIKLLSSDEEDESVSSTLTVANKSTEYIITTSDGGDSTCDLSHDDEEKIQLIYHSLVDQYSGDQSKYDEFLATMSSMLEDEIDITNDCNLQYLYDLLNETFHTGSVTTGINVSNYIAPNCKTYRVSYNTGKIAYTSPDFKTPTYFINRHSLTRYIDSKNPGDCHLMTTVAGTWYFTNTNPQRHIAPNGKVYTIQSGSGKYTSAELTSSRSFSTLSALRRYLDSKNPAYAVWNHTVDTTFQPVNHTAPNGKVYKIYKTNKGYMSYKLLNIKYYSTLNAIKSYIDRNNPR